MQTLHPVRSEQGLQYHHLEHSDPYIDVVQSSQSTKEETLAWFEDKGSRF